MDKRPDSRRLQLPRVHIEAHRHRFFREAGEALPDPTLAVRESLRPFVGAYYKNLPNWIGAYYEGLLSQYGLEVDQRALDPSTSNEFLVMGTSVIESLRTDCTLDDVRLFLMAHQTIDTLVPFRSTTNVLCSRFSIEASAHVLTGQELTSAYIALTILRTALVNDGFSGAGLLLVVDQAWLPHQGLWKPHEKVDTALVIKFTKDAHSGSTSMDGCHYWTQEGADPSWILQCTYAYLESRHLDVADVHVVAGDPKLHQVFADAIRPAKLSIADARHMSCAGLVRALDVVNQGCASVLLTHLADDGRLYLFSFHRNEPGQNIPCSI